jgi:hypothetical protein
MKISIHIHPYIDTSCPSLLPEGQNEEENVACWCEPLVNKLAADPCLYVERKMFYIYY